MGTSTLFQGDEFKSSSLCAALPEESTLQLAANNSSLMDMIYGILGQGDGPTSPTLPITVEHDLSKAKVLQWASSLSEYQSPVDTTPPPIYPEYDHSTPQSSSPMGSMFSESSSHDSSSGPKTPTLSNPVPMIRKKFSWEKAERVPNPTTKRSSGSLNILVPPRASSHNHTNSSPSPSPVPAMKATITSLVDDFMPGFLPDFEPAPVKTKPAKPPVLRISTEVPPYPVTPTSRRPELIYPPSLQIGSQVAHLASPQSSTHSSPLRRSSEVRRSPLKHLHGNFSPHRQSVSHPPKSTLSQERPRIQARHSISSSPNRQAHVDDSLRGGPRPPVLSVVVEERPQIPSTSASVYSSTNRKPYDNRGQYRRKSTATPSPATTLLTTPEYLQNQARYSMMPLPRKPLPRKPLQTEQRILSPTRPPPSIPLETEQQAPAQIRHSLMPLPNKHFQVEQQKHAPIRHSLPAPARRTQQELEAIPEPASSKPEEPTVFGTNLGIWDTKGLFAGEQGLQFTMSRRVVNMSKMEWEILSPGGSRVLKCYEQTNTLSRRRDFFDAEGNQLFDFQKRIGSTRTAECPKGSTLFVIKNGSLHLSPHWTVSLGSTSDNAITQWVAKGDESMGNVIVTWGGFQVGRISSESGLKKHMYHVSIAPEMNYAIMAALTAVLDDLRTDEGC
ncbi:hypothetical protein BGZ57DRAFT_925783 [Hyaloscypha finlandica]|nr:hypothetical protein BGZ57DRAFT_925783 [Hyaloscypha finlandica]KAH8784806.1 hypothetical protein F5882DRAFT_124060 [Hyaloscypha sp. PMI_1271]